MSAKPAASPSLLARQAREALDGLMALVGTELTSTEAASFGRVCGVALRVEQAHAEAMRGFKVWHGTYSTPRNIEALHRDGRPARQVVVAVRATSQKAAAAALRVGGGYLRDYFGVEPAAVYTERCPLLAVVEPGTLVVRPMDPGDTVNGQNDWIEVPPRG